MDINRQIEERQEEEKSKKKLVILILSITTILVALIGGSFAYLTAVVKTPKGRESIILGTTTLQGVTYKATDNLTLVDALPGDSTNATVTIANPNASARVRYTLKVVADVNDFSKEDGMGQLLVKIKQGDMDEVVLDFTDKDIREQYLVTNVELAPQESDTYNVTLEFKELGVNQDTNQTKTFAAHVEITQSIVVSE